MKKYEMIHSREGQIYNKSFDLKHRGDTENRKTGPDIKSHNGITVMILIRIGNRTQEMIVILLENEHVSIEINLDPPSLHVKKVEDDHVQCRENHLAERDPSLGTYLIKNKIRKINLKQEE